MDAVAGRAEGMPAAHAPTGNADGGVAVACAVAGCDGALPGGRLAG